MLGTMSHKVVRKPIIHFGVMKYEQFIRLIFISDKIKYPEQIQVVYRVTIITPSYYLFL